MNSENAIIKRASASVSTSELLDSAAKINRGNDDFVQLFDPNYVINSNHLLAARADANLAFKLKTNVSKNMATETLLFAGMTKQITKAIEKMGIKSNSDFIVFASNRKAYNSIKGLLSKEKDFRQTKEGETAAAHAFGIEKISDEEILQKMAAPRFD